MGVDQETPAETIDRNWDELLQELRVTQTGVQILTGFLLTVPFSNRFPQLDRVQQTGYLVVLGGSMLTTALVIAPVVFHRVLFRRRRRRWLVEAANRCARAGHVVMALTSAGVLALVFDVVVSRTAGVVALAVGILGFGLLWGLVPLIERARNG